LQAQRDIIPHELGEFSFHFSHSTDHRLPSTPPMRLAPWIGGITQFTG
jgi:hypothetical protein